LLQGFFHCKFDFPVHYFRKFKSWDKKVCVSLKPEDMKKFFTLSSFGILSLFLFMALIPANRNAGPLTDTYIIIAWNDLGMHCANKDFSNMAILPPYNNQNAHVILKGTTTTWPQVMGPTSGISVTYEIPGNTYSGSTTNTDKTNFWVWAQHIFGVTLQPSTGLTGLGMTGTMADSNNFFNAQGIPITPYLDANLVTEDPFQLALIKAIGLGSVILASTQSVIPVSNEINCVSSGCHDSELGILDEHPNVSGFNISDKPILCANCHGDNALGYPNQPGVASFSQVIHQQHGEETNNCYKCHPGPNTQCFRDVMHTAGMTCQDCHGSVSNVGNSIEDGRVPWLQEPSCGATSCHGTNYSEEPGKLFRQSKGHGNLFCSTCHGSPHAIVPSENERDNLQNVTLQGFAGILRTCEVCHGYIPNGPGPHGYNPLGIRPVSSIIPANSTILQNYPNPCSSRTTIPYMISREGHVTLEILDIQGKVIKNMVNQPLKAGEYSIETSVTGLTEGTYICRLTVDGSSFIRKIFVIR
jgi:hypothetical protein